MKTATVTRLHRKYAWFLKDSILFIILSFAAVQLSVRKSVKVSVL